METENVLMEIRTRRINCKNNKELFLDLKCLLIHHNGKFFESTLFCYIDMIDCTKRNTYSE